MFDAADPGAVTVKVQADTDEIRIVLLKDHWQPGYGMPNVVVPKGLSTQREWYLFDQIRQYRFKKINTQPFFFCAFCLPRPPEVAEQVTPTPKPSHGPSPSPCQISAHLVLWFGRL